MNNSIDLLFRWRISLGMYRTFFLFFFFCDNESKSWRSVAAREGPAILFPRPILHFEAVRNDVLQELFL